MATMIEFSRTGDVSSPRSLRLRYLGLAFFWACSMLTFRSAILLTGNADTPEFNTLVVVVSFLANMTTLFSISALVERTPENLAKFSPWLFCGAIIAGIALIHLAGARFEGSGLVAAALVAGSALAGVGYGYFWGSWADVLGRMHPSRTVLYAPAALLLTTVLFLGISLAASLAAVPPVLLMAPLPVISLLCLIRCRTDSACEPEPQAEGRRYLTALTSLVPLIIATLVFSCLFGFMWETAVLSVDSATDAHGFPLVLNLVAALGLFIFVIASRRHINLSWTYQLLIPISIVLFAVVPFFWTVHPVILNAIMSAIYGVFDVIIWYMVAATAYDFAVSGFVVGGLVRALSILARLIGIGIGYLVMLVPEVASGAIVGVCIAAVYLLVMLLWFLWHSAKHPSFEVPEDDDDAEPAPSLTGPAIVYGCMNLGSKPTANENGTDGTFSAEGAEIASANAEAAMANATADAAGAEKEPPVDDTPDEAVFALIAEDYGLTHREAEVLPYLARGRSAKVIAEALFVSESTIRTHTRRIFEKTCIHSKQELIDLVDKY
ncbi:LuxR C-terminal-related transcriptional regulator [Adlercreutzia caecimuris]|uniref:LuxR C-terminal-related transcriptional regulator n=1 Tax=Adlercreutzia caecimuris TaxID=671266 RepID=UPI002729A7D7|nr:LuxR C-terminal-related transcriptional regulator [Adlercreutzia caecimuris]